MKTKNLALGLSAALLGLTATVMLAQTAPSTPTTPTQPAPTADAPAAAPGGRGGFAGGRGGRGGPAGPLPVPATPASASPVSAAVAAKAAAGPYTWPNPPAAPTIAPTPFASTDHLKWAPTPPMGWNSWDCYGAGIWQDDVMANIDYMDKNLKAHGWQYITIDIQWYEPLAHTETYRPGAALVSDANGRLHPAPNRFPLTADTGSFKPIADYIHSKGLKFGLHLMRGIPRQAVDRDNAPILGTSYHAQEIVDRNNVCGWNNDMYGIDMSKPGAQEYYDSVFALLASWDLDFVKVDDLSGHAAEIEAIRKAIDKTGRPIVFSVSPGGRSNEQVATNANLWRISNDFWDRWDALYNQFGNLNAGTPFRGPGHWPDADMIPFGHIKIWSSPTRVSSFTPDEQYTLMSLWSIGRSPLIYGGNMPQNDAFTLSLLTNDEVLAVNQKSTNNKQVFNQDNKVAWVADVPDSKDKYVALFNTSPAPAGGARGGRGGAPAAAPAIPQIADPVAIKVTLDELGLKGPVTVRDLWNRKDPGPMTDAVAATVNSHGAVLYRVSPAQ